MLSTQRSPLLFFLLVFALSAPVWLIGAVSRWLLLPDVPVVLRSREELAAGAARNPFLKRGIDIATLHVAFLADIPNPTCATALDATRSPGDSFILCGRDIYLWLPNGVARTKLTNDYFDRTLKTVSTIRNWNTVLKLLEMIQNR